jgi:hypothetical protein
MKEAEQKEQIQSDFIYIEFYEIQTNVWCQEADGELPLAFVLMLVSKYSGFQCESMPCVAILISTSKNPCSFLLLLILSLQQN